MYCGAFSHRFVDTFCNGSQIEKMVKDLEDQFKLHMDKPKPKPKPPEKKDEPAAEPEGESEPAGENEPESAAEPMETEETGGN
eukprot:SAG31_NODE_4929_length_2855_cov_1.699057_5_plen_83_part_00